MKDKELLELAAKAAGLMVGSDEGEYRYRDDGTWVAGLYATDNGYPIFWNPLIDDRDALRLAVKLGIGMVHHLGWGQVFHPSFHGERIDFHYDPDAQSATRRAITRVAAEIARTTDTGGEA
ncbi:hypothetical protein [Burkholderia glumae]|uniref:hypothetical protein n=1 Tax=Burkholderia glumae TaxID=337 RepID=UPI00215179DF|nr:hypothetical protein [Burkholderia glumae]